MRRADRSLSAARTLAAIGVALCMTAGAVSPRADSLRLKYVVILTRHGVRAPTWDAARLGAYSSAPWPEWGVAPGELTPHGRLLMTLMGSYYRHWLSSEGLLASPPCANAGHVYVWADAGQRTRETGRALAESLLPGCGVPVNSVSGAQDSLFDPIATGMSAVDPDLAARAVGERLGPDPRRFLEPHRSEFDALQDILSGDRPVSRRLFDSLADVTVTGNGKSVDLGGPLGIASTFSENLLLEYANGFSGADLGWGRLTRENLDRVLTLHGLYADLTRRTPYLARARGSNLATRILHSLEQASTGHSDAQALGRPDAAVLIISGHDTNLSNMSGMLGLSWKVADYQRGETPPGGALVFSLWRDEATREDFVRTQFVAQTLEQMRLATPLTLETPPAQAAVAIPGCEADVRGCRWPTFAQVLQRAIDPPAER